MERIAMERAMRHVIAFLKDERAATAIEYGLIATGIAVAIIPVLTGVGSKTKATFTLISTAIKYRRRKPRSRQPRSLQSARRGRGLVPSSGWVLASHLF